MSKSPRTVVLVTARLKSTRLPRKALRTLGDRPLLVHLFDRLKRMEVPDEVALITSPVEQDDPLEELAAEHGVGCFRGHPDDVLLRMRDGADKFGGDQIFSCTGDNPFVDPEMGDALLRWHREQEMDFTKCWELPFGGFGYGVRKDAASRAIELKDETDTEVWGGYFANDPDARCGDFRPPEELIWPDLRLTVDTDKDFEMAEAVVNELGPNGEVFGLREIVELCRARPDIAGINAEIEQKAGIPVRFKSQADAASDEESKS